MYWQRKRLHTESAVDANTTYRYRLPELGLYTAFAIRVEAQRHLERIAAASPQQIFEAITKIEMLHDGTSVIKSLRGGELLALNTFDFGKIPSFQHRERDDRYNFVTFYLLAGRSLQDKEYCFDMARFGAPTLEITNALIENVQSAWKTDTLSYQIYGWRAVGAPQPRPRGYFRANERTYYTTSATDAEKIVEVTPGKLIRRILLKGWTVSTSVAGHIKKLEFEIDEGSYSPVVIDSMSEWALQNKVDYGLDLKHTHRVYLPQAGGDNTVETFMPYHSDLSLQPFGVPQTEPSRVMVYDGGTATVVVTVAGEFYATIDGAGYQRAVLIGFDKDPALADLFDARAVGKIKLILTEGNADKVVSVCVEELMTY